MNFLYITVSLYLLMLNNLFLTTVNKFVIGKSKNNFMNYCNKC